VPFDYVQPASLSDLWTILAASGPKARLLAGGTDLLVRLRLRHVAPDVVVDLKRVRELSPAIAEADGHLRIGALATMTDVAEDARVGRRFPALVEAASVVGSVQIRNRATLAGNLCNASPAADTAPALLVHDASVNLISQRGRRSVPLAGFFQGPGRTVLTDDEILESVDLPLRSTPVGDAFERITRRRGVDLATINVSCTVSRSSAARFAFGAVGPRPFAVADRSGVLSDRAASPEQRDAALRLLIDQAAPISDVRGSAAYRRAMLLVASRRALCTAHERLLALVSPEAR
jgi:CO/xanthine dehydrogenase FAD-binding subunit